NAPVRGRVLAHGRSRHPLGLDAVVTECAIGGRDLKASREEQQLTDRRAYVGTAGLDARLYPYGRDDRRPSLPSAVSDAGGSAAGRTRNRRRGPNLDSRPIRAPAALPWCCTRLCRQYATSCPRMGMADARPALY